MALPPQQFMGKTPVGTQRVAATTQQTQVQPQMQQLQPQYGLSGAEQALNAGLGAGTSLLEQGANLLGGNFAGSAVNVDPTTGQKFFTQAAEGVGQYSPAGLQAQGVQSALSGAQGQAAFDAALLNSPQQAFLRQQGEEGIINQAAALGGLGGGDVRKELVNFGQGLASTQLQQQINNLSNLSNQGLQAAGQQGQFLSQAGQQQGNLAAQNAQLGTQANLYSQGANMFGGVGSSLANLRYQAGRDIASQIGTGTNQLANLTDQQGTGLSDIIGQGSVNVGNLLSGSGQYTAGQQTQLAQLLANLATQQGAQAAQGQQAIGQAQAGGITGRADAIRDTATRAATALSDISLKNDIVSTGSENGFNTYSWTWNDNHPDKNMTGKKESGVIAQEVELVYPQAVSFHDSGYKQVDYSMIGVTNAK